MPSRSPPSADARTITAAQVERECKRVLKEALAYFGIPDHWDVSVYYSGTDEGSAAQITIDGTYLRASIRVDTNYLQACPTEIRRCMAHEVAHLLTAPYQLAWEDLPEDVREEYAKHYTRADENVTVHLERLFMAHCSPKKGR